MQEFLDGFDSDAGPPYIPQPWEDSSNDSTESIFSSQNRGKRHNMRSIEEANSHHLPRPTVLAFEPEDSSSRPGPYKAVVVPREEQSPEQINNEGQFSPNMPEGEELAQVLDGNAVNEQEIEVGRPDQLINWPKRIRHKRSAPETWV